MIISSTLSKHTNYKTIKPFSFTFGPYCPSCGFYSKKCAVSSIIPPPSLIEINVVVIVITCTVSRG